MPEPYQVSVPAAWRLLMSRTLDSIALEVEFAARHEDLVRRQFAFDWDRLEPVPGNPDGTARWVYGALADDRVLFVVIGQLVAERQVELVGFRIIEVDHDGEET